MAHFRIRYVTLQQGYAYWHLRATTKEEARRKFRTNLRLGNIPDCDPIYPPQIKQISNLLNPFL